MGDEVLSSIISGGLGIINNQIQGQQNYNRTRNLMGIQLQNQQTLNAQQLRNQMLLNEQGMQQQLEMWKRTNYPAQVQMLKSAGLNPALLYGKGGMGGATSGSQTGGSAQGGSAGMGMAPPPNYMDIASLSKIGAEIALLKAQEKKTLTEAGLGEAETELRKAEMYNVHEATKLLTQQITTESMKQETIKLQNEISSVEKESKELSLKLDKATFEAKVQTIEQNLENVKQTNLKIIEETRSAQIDNDNKQKLINQQITLNNWAMVEAQVRIQAAKKGIEVSDNQIFKMRQEVLQGWANVQTNQDALTTSEKNTKALADATIKSAWIVGGLSLGGNLAKLFIPMNAVKTVVSGFGGK